MKLWIDVIGGESNKERVVARGGIEDIDKGVDEYNCEVEGTGGDKYFELQTDTKDIIFNNAEEYYSTVRPRLISDF